MRALFPVLADAERTHGCVVRSVDVTGRTASPDRTG
jgi:hypothetical protein